MRFLKPSAWPKVKAWGAWEGDDVPSGLAIRVCGVNQLPNPLGENFYRTANYPGATGFEWISGAASRKAAAKLVRSFGAEMKKCADGYGRYSDDSSAAKVVELPSARAKAEVKVFAINYLSGRTDPPRPSYALWAVGQRGHRVVVLRLGAAEPHASAPVKGFTKTALAAVDLAVK